MNAFSRFFKRIDWPNHMMAFLSTLLGVWLAFYLGNYNENKIAHARMEVAMASVQEELQNNEENMKSHAAQMDSMLQAVGAFSEMIDENMDLIATEKQMDTFLEEFGWFLSIQSKKPLRDSLFEYHGSLNLALNFSGVSDIAWENTKLMDILHLVDTKTAFQLHSLYRHQDEVRRLIGEGVDILKNLFQSDNDSDTITKTIVNELKGQLHFTLAMEQALLKNYKNTLKKLAE